MFLSNPRFVLVMVIISSYFGIPSVKAVVEVEIIRYRYAGYDSTTDAEEVVSVWCGMCGVCGV